MDALYLPISWSLFAVGDISLIDNISNWRVSAEYWEQRHGRSLFLWENFILDQRKPQDNILLR